MNTNRLLKAVALLVLMILPAILVQAQTNRRTSQAKRAFRAPILTNIDKVELMSIESRMGNIEKVEATKLVEGQEAQNILAIWRKQKFSGYSAAACHLPPYALRFYSKGQVVLFATVCWACHNVTFIVPNTKRWVDFKSDLQAAKLLREIFEKAFPSEHKFG